MPTRRHLTPNYIHDFALKPLQWVTGVTNERHELEHQR